MVAILTLAAEAGRDIDCDSFEDMSRIKRNPNGLGRFYIFMKSQYNLLTGVRSKETDWEMRNFFCKNRRKFVYDPSQKFRAGWNVLPVAFF